MLERVGRSFRGVVIPGRGLGAPAMSVADVKEAIKRIAGIGVVPGTLNLRLGAPFDGVLEGYVTEKELGVSVWKDHSPSRKGVWFGEVLIEGRFRGIVFQGDEPEYPSDQVEIMSDHHLRTTLGLKDGDAIEFAMVLRSVS